MRARALTDFSRAGAGKEDLMSTLAYFGTNIATEKRRVARELQKEALREISLSEWSFVDGGLQLVPEVARASAYSLC